MATGGFTQINIVVVLEAGWTVASMIMLCFHKKKNIRSLILITYLVKIIFPEQSPRGELMRIFWPGNIQSTVNGHVEVFRVPYGLLCGLIKALDNIHKKHWNHTLSLWHEWKAFWEKGCSNKRIVLAYSHTVAYVLNRHSLSHLPFSLSAVHAV